VGTLRFALVFAGLCTILFVYGYVYARLGATIGWREDYGFTCRRRCMVEDLWHSRKLLEGGTGAELAMFALIWFVPVTVTLIGLHAAGRRAIRRQRTRIRPMPRD